MKQFNTVLRRNTRAFIGGALMLMSTLFAGAQTHIPTGSLTLGGGATFNANTSTCVTGQIGDHWTSGTGYWEYHINTVGFNTITMTFKQERSSTGPATGAVVYVDPSNPLVEHSIGSSFTAPTSCPASALVYNLPPACEGVAALVIRVRMSPNTNTAGTHRMPTEVFDGIAAVACTPTGASISTSSPSICAGSSATLTLTGASAGTTFQWQSSPDSSTWSNLTGATGATFNTPATQTTTTYYRVVVTCSGGASSNTAGVKETIKQIAFGAISGLSSTFLTVGQAGTLSVSTPSGGSWVSSNTSRAPIDASLGSFSANAGGLVTFKYSAFDATTGCFGSTDTTVAIVWPNTLALYAGDSGTTTQVITIPNETTNNLSATGFGAAGTCTSGGVSVVTSNTVTAFSQTGPHIGYTIFSTTGHRLNVSRIHVTTRESGTGPDSAILAYRVDGAATWVTEGAATAQVRTGSCGAATNSWDFTPSLLIMGAKSVEVAVFPFHASGASGTFQVNSLEVYGKVSDSIVCSGLGHPGTLETPTSWVICDSGSRFLNYDMSGAGVGMHLTWQQSADGISFTDISPLDTTAAYNTGVLHTSTPFNVYRVELTCGTNTPVPSGADTILVHSKPAIGTVVSQNSTNYTTNFLHQDETDTLSLSAGGSMTWWSSNDSSAVAIDSASGGIIGRIPGVAVITAHTSNEGVCFNTTTDTIRNIQGSSVAVYVGLHGTSVTATGVGGVADVSDLSQSGFTAGTNCSFGGLSGMILPAGVTSYGTGNPFVSLTVTPQATYTIDGLTATLRSSSTGPHFARLVYNLNNTGWVTDGNDNDLEVNDCGKSSELIQFTGTLPSLVHAGNTLEIRVYPFYGVGDPTGGVFQVNTIGLVSTTASTTLKKTPPVVAVNPTQADAIKLQLFPNPTTSVLNVTATEPVNVTILSADGKKVIEQNNAKQINVSNLAKGLYLAQVTDAKGNLIETTKFIKQ